MIFFACDEVGHIDVECPNKNEKDEKKFSKYKGKKDYKSYKDKSKKSCYELSFLMLARITLG